MAQLFGKLVRINFDISADVDMIVNTFVQSFSESSWANNITHARVRVSN